MRRFGTPKTEEERLETHQFLYGDTELPARGAGLMSRQVGAGSRELATVFTPNRFIIASATTAALTGMAGFALTQKLKDEDIGLGRMGIIAIGSGCIAGLSAFLVTRYIS